MKHHALLGLMLGLFAAARLGAEDPILFNVSIDGLNMTITATGAAPLAPGPGVASDLELGNGGITFVNLFNSGFDHTTAYNPIGGILVRNALGDQTLPLNAPDPFNEALSSGAFPDTTINNAGRNLGIWNFAAETSITVGNFGGFVEGSSLTITFTTSPNESLTGNGPFRVYLGANQSYGGDGFIGTFAFTAVPEPSTYAAIAGGLGLLAAVIHRRRQRAQAAQA